MVSGLHHIPLLQANICRGEPEDEGSNVDPEAINHNILKCFGVHPNMDNIFYFIDTNFHFLPILLKQITFFNYNIDAQLFLNS